MAFAAESQVAFDGCPMAMRALKAHVEGVNAWREFRNGFLESLGVNRAKPSPGATVQVASAPAATSPGIAGSATLRGTGDFDVNAVGESHYVPALLKVAGVRRNNTTAEIETRALVSLVPEPDNPYDCNAVAVVGEAGRKLGYLSREDAEECCDALSRWPSPPTCWAEIGGCHRDGRWIIGVRLDLDFDQF